MRGVELGRVVLILADLEASLVFEQRLEIHVQRPVFALQAHLGLVVEQQTHLRLLLRMAHKVHLIEFGGDIFDFTHHAERQGFVFEVLNVVELFLVPLFEKPLVVCGKFLTEVALDVVLGHSGHQRVFTHVDFLREGGGVFVLGVLPVLFVVRRHHIDGVRRFT